MITTLAGPNDFALSEDLKRLVKEFQAAHGDLAVERLDGEEADFAKLREAAVSLPFLAARKLVILRAPSANKQFVEQFEALLGEVPDTTDLILVEPKLDKRTVYYKTLKRQTEFRDFPELDDQALAGWLVAAAKRRSVSLNSADARYLVDRAGTNQQLLSSELDKLSLYDSKITRATIDLLTDQSPQSTIFQLLEAAFAGNDRQALKLYDEQRALKVEPPQIVAMLAWQLHAMAVVKTAGDRPVETIAKEAKLNPFVVRKSQTAVRHLTLASLKRLITELADLDSRSKTAGIDTDEALRYYLLSLSA